VTESDCVLRRLHARWALAVLTALSVFAMNQHANAIDDGTAHPNPIPEKFDPDQDPDLKLAAQIERAFQKVAARVAPTVVSLTVFTKGDEWREGLWKIHEQPAPAAAERKFTGSGVVVGSDGTILTNEHVVRGAESIRVTMNDGATFMARVAGMDVRSDLAVLSPAEELKRTTPFASAVLADSDQIRVGQWAIAVGNPFELANTLTVGVVSARSRSLPARTFAATDVFYGNLIQTDAAINPGNSGGPLFNLRGELIGVNTMIFSKTGKFEGFGFAIPSNHIKPRLAALKAGRTVPYGWLGVVLSDLEQGQTAFKVPEGKGVLIERVIPDSPADRAGLQQGTVVLSFEGVPVASANELIMAVGAAAPGQSATVHLRTPKGEAVALSVRIGLRTPELIRHSRFDGLEPRTEAEPEVPGEFSWRGMRVRELSSEETRKHGGRLMVVAIRKASPADRAGLYEGAILDQLKHGGNEAIIELESLAQLRRIALEAKGGVYLHLPGACYLLLDAESGK